MLDDRPAAGLVLISLMTEKTYKIGRGEGDQREEERRGGEGKGGEGRNDDKGMGGGLDDGVMCCFRANCFCDSGTTSFIAIGYNQELMEAWANGTVCHGVRMGGSVRVFLLLLVNLWEQKKKKKRMCFA